MAESEGESMPGVSLKFSVDNAQFAKLLKKLGEVEPKAARKAIRQGVNEVSKLVLAEAKSRVPMRTGLLKKSLGRKVKSKMGGAVVYAVIKPRRGVWVKADGGAVGTRTRFRNGKKQVFVRKWQGEFNGKKVDPVKYAHLVEYGRREVVNKKKKVLSDGTTIFGKKVRSVAPHPFLRPAWEKYERRAPAIFAACLRHALLNYWLGK
jgi:HK97 gp10 family phage protein